MSETSPAAGARPALPLIGALSITQTVGYGVLLYAFGVLLAPMSDELGWSTATLSAGPSIGLVVAALCAPWVGRRIDVAGARGLMTAGSLLGGLAVLAWAATTSLAGYALAWAAIGGAMAAALYPPAFAAVVRHAPGVRRGAVLSITLAAGFASTIFAPLTALLEDAFGWRGALVVLAAALIACGVPLHWAGLPRRGRVVRPLEPAGPSTGEEQRAGPAPTLRGDRRLRRLVVALALAKGTTVAVGVHVVAFLIGRGLTPTLAATLAGGLGAAKVAGRLLVGVTTPERRVATALVVCFAAQASGLLLGVAGVPVGLPGLSVEVAMVALFGAGAGAATLLRPLLVVEVFGTGSYGLVDGRAQRVVQLAEAAAPFAVGALVTATAGYRWAWVLLAACCALAAVLLPRPGSDGHPRGRRAHLPAAGR